MKIMFNKWLRISIMLLLLLQAFPLPAGAVGPSTVLPGGLLSASLATNTTGLTYPSEVGRITDGNSTPSASTSATFLESGKSITYTLGSATTVRSMFLSMYQGTVSLYNASGTLVRQITGVGYGTYYVDFGTGYSVKTIVATNNYSGPALITELQAYTTNIDTTPPGNPLNVTASNITTNSIQLDFKAPTDSDMSYVKFYKDETYLTYQYVSANATGSYVFTGLSPNTSYSLKATSVDTWSNESSGTTITATTLSNTPLTTPVGLTATVGDAQITLNWTANTESNLASYKVYKDDVYLATITKPTTTYTATSLTNGQTYSFSITSISTSSIESTKSTPITVTPQVPDNTPPGEVTNLAETHTGNSVTLTWTNPLDTDFKQVNIYKWNTTTSTWDLVSTP